MCDVQSYDNHRNDQRLREWHNKLARASEGEYKPVRLEANHGLDWHECHESIYIDCDLFLKDVKRRKFLQEWRAGHAS